METKQTSTPKGRPVGKARQRKAQRSGEVASILARLRENGGGSLAPSATEAASPAPSRRSPAPAEPARRKPAAKPAAERARRVPPFVDEAVKVFATEPKARRTSQPKAAAETARTEKPRTEKTRVEKPRQAASTPRRTTKTERTASPRRSGERKAKSAPVRSQQAEPETRPMVVARRTERRNPPVMARRNLHMASTPRQAHGSAARRTYYVALDTPGAEVRLPALPSIQVGWRAVSGIIVLLLLASLLAIWRSPAFMVATLQAEGLQRLTVSDLSTVTGILGQSIFALDPALLETTLQQAFPEFAEVDVSVGLPASVRITVTERQPVLAWTQDGRDLWADAEGVTFPPRGELQAPLVQVQAHSFPVPASDDPAARLRLPDGLVDTIQAMAAHAPEGAVIVYDAEHGLGWDDQQGWEVFFGAEPAADMLNEMGMKLVVYDAIVAYLDAEEIQPELISVEYVHAPYYRMER